MDPKRFKEAYTRLDLLDERLGHKVRSRSLGPRRAPSLGQVDEQLRTLAEFTVELKEIVQEMMLAIGTKPKS
jgi:hypothetical protein